ncbi:MAG: TfoX/Sxy family protein [Saprospiraceae bacterium]|nr:TfoX/Sxy family protein [Saprospiraceae bacterium]
MENHITATRIADVLTAKGIAYEQKRMFGGDCFMVDDKMLMGTYKGGIMARVDPDEEPTLTQRPGVASMIHGGRAMPGFLMVDPIGYEDDADLEFWVVKAMEYNPKAKSSKKKK